MKEFIMAALPFVIIGICIIILIVNSKYNKKDKNSYLLEGLSLGMCFGLCFSNSLNIDLGLGLSLGMLIGEAIGSAIKK